MTDSEKLARWQGWEPKEYDVEDFDGYVYQEYEPTPDYLNDDAAAIRGQEI